MDVSNERARAHPAWPGAVPEESDRDLRQRGPRSCDGCAVQRVELGEISGEMMMNELVNKLVQ